MTIHISGRSWPALEAVVMGCCNWACAFGPVLRAGLGETLHGDLKSFETSIDGQPMHVFIEHLDRAVITEGCDASPQTGIGEARERLGREGWLLRRVRSPVSSSAGARPAGVAQR